MWGMAGVMKVRSKNVKEKGKRIIILECLGRKVYWLLDSPEICSSKIH